MPNANNLTHNDFLNRTNLVHNFKYEYLEEYTSLYTPLDINCPEHRNI